MALIKCPECRKAISDSASRCPHCGYPITPEKIAAINKAAQANKKGCMVACLFAVGFFFIVIILGSLSSKPDEAYKTGLRYYEGVGVTKDYAEALKWYRKAANQGHSLAQYDIGSMYYNGEGVNKDVAEALNWYQKAADQGNSLAIYRLKTLAPDRLKTLAPKATDNRESSTSSSKPDVEIKDGIAKKSLEMAGYLETETNKAMEIFYKIAHAYPSVETIEISCIMRSDNHMDRYGNKMKGDFVNNGKEYWSMGSLTFSKGMIDEIRRYKTEANYTDDQYAKAQVYLMIKELKHSGLLPRLR